MTKEELLEAFEKDFIKGNNNVAELLLKAYTEGATSALSDKRQQVEKMKVKPSDGCLEDCNCGWCRYELAPKNEVIDDILTILSE